MQDKILRATIQNDMVRIIGGVTTNLVSEGVELHDCTPVASAAFGRMLTAGAILGCTLKSSDDVITTKINGNGEIRGITVTAHSDGSVKGVIGNPYVSRPLNSKGKLDVGGAVGTDGLLYVIKDMGLKNPYVGQVPIRTGEIAEDFAYYFTVSEQIPSAVALGVLVGKDLKVQAAGGFMVQMMPGASDLLADLITYRLQEIPPVTTLINEGRSAEELLEYVFKDMDLKILGEISPKYKCDCSREKTEKAFISIGKKDLTEIYNEGKTEEIVCNFCNKKYHFTHEQIGELLKRSQK